MVGFCLILSLGMRVHGRGDYESHRRGFLYESGA
jgi:hypothetical protein